MGANEKKIKGRILVVDDEQRICEAVKKALERIGYTVETSLNAFDALEKFKRSRYEMVICDIKMPEMDGIALLDRIKEHDPTTLVIMITGYASIESAIESIKKGAQEYIPKPFTPDQLRLFVERAFERRRLADENVYLRGELKHIYGKDVVVGQSQTMRRVFDLAARVAGTDSSLFSRGTTPGKNLLGMRVIKEDGQHAGFLTMLIRECIGKWISGLVFALGFLWILFDRDNQGWHDKLMSTYVIG